MIEHIVLLKLKEGVGEDKAKALIDGLNELKKAIPGYLTFQADTITALKVKAPASIMVLS